MKILNEKPPEWIMQGCMNQFRVDISKTFWTYGDTIYNPGGLDLPKHIIVHEEVHERQQLEYCVVVKHHSVGLSTDTIETRKGKDAWWKRFLTDPRFRMEQEAEAYGAQYAFFCDRVKDRNERARFLNSLVISFSGPLYQLSLTQQQARAMILVLSGQRKLEDVTK